MALTKVSAGVLNTDDLYGFRNRIINGAIEIDQRNSGASVTANNDVYPVDRFFFVAAQSSKMTAQQNQGSVTPPAGFRNYLGITSSSAYTSGASEVFTFRQIIEGFNIADLDWGTANAKTVTLSFWVRSSLTGNFGGSILNVNGTRSYPFTYTIRSANTWEYETITIPGDTTGTWFTDNQRGIQIHWNLGTGSTISGTADTWSSNTFYSATGSTSVLATNGATWQITGVQFERGSVATPFERRPYGLEMLLCQRYYERVYSRTGCRNGNFGGWSHESYQCEIPFVLKRATPAITYVNYNTNIAGTPWSTRDFQPTTSQTTHKFNARYFAFNEYIYLDNANGSLLADAELT